MRVGLFLCSAKYVRLKYVRFPVRVSNLNEKKIGFPIFRANVRVAVSLRESSLRKKPQMCCYFSAIKC